MAGHSKWANIKHRKAAQDAKRGKIFTRFIREITVAARQGGGDPDANPRLRAAIDKALGGNMTRDTIERAIKRGTGDLDGVDYEDILFEGYAPSGVAVMVETSTDNRNRTVSEVRHAFSKYGGNLGTDGSVAFQFNRLGTILFAPGADEDSIMEAAIEAGAEDVVVEEDGSIEVITAAEDFHSVVTALYEANLEPEESEVGYKATIETELDADSADKVLKLLDALEELDDVQNVHSNAVFPEVDEA